MPDLSQIDMGAVQKRQRAMILFMLGLVLSFVTLLSRSVFAGFPAAPQLFYMPLLPTLLMTLAIWFYPSLDLSPLRRSYRFAIRVFSTASLFLAPFALWLTELPDRHYFQVCTAFYFLTGAITLMLYARFIAHAASPGSGYRLLSNYIYYALLFLLVFPLGVFTLYVSLNLNVYYEILQCVPSVVTTIAIHPILILAGLLIFWNPQDDIDVPLKKMLDSPEEPLFESHLYVEQ